MIRTGLVICYWCSWEYNFLLQKGNVDMNLMVVHKPRFYFVECCRLHEMPLEYSSDTFCEDLLQKIKIEYIKFSSYVVYYKFKYLMLFFSFHLFIRTFSALFSSFFSLFFTLFPSKFLCLRIDWRPCHVKNSLTPNPGAEFFVSICSTPKFICFRMMVYLRY